MKIKFSVKTGDPYLVNKVTYHVQDSNLYAPVVLRHYKSHIKKEKPLDLDLLDKERERIRDVVRNSGYFYFNKEHVKFLVDTTDMVKRANITIEVVNPITSSGDTTIQNKHQKSNTAQTLSKWSINSRRTRKPPKMTPLSSPSHTKRLLSPSPPTIR